MKALCPDHVPQIQLLSSKILSEILPNTQNTVDRKEDKTMKDNKVLE